MRSMNAGLCVAALLVGAGAGFIAGRHVTQGVVIAGARGGGSVASRDVQAAAVTEETRRLHAEVARLQAAAASPAPAAAAGSARSIWQVLAALQKDKMLDPNIQFMNSRGELSDAFQKLFNLSPTERDALQQKTNEVLAKLQALERTNTVVKRNADGSVTIAVASFAQKGGALYDEFLAGFGTVLGSERQEAFLAMGAEQVEDALGRFGVVQRTVTVKKVQTAEGKPSYSFSDEQVVGRQEKSTSHGELNSADALSRWLGSLGAYVPAGF